jgi:hypothetical protein
MAAPGSDAPVDQRATNGALTAQSRGALGMKGTDLESSKESNVIKSDTRNVHLDGGTQILLRTE